MAKINGHTVRGGWSTQGVWGKVNGRDFSLWPKDTFVTNRGMIKRIVKKIEEGKIELPQAVSNQNLYYLMPDKSIVPFN